MDLAHVTKEVGVSIDLLWSELSNFGKLKSLYPADGVEGLGRIDKVDCDGNHVGATRRVYMASGAVLIERLEALDESRRSLRYSLASPNGIDVEGYLATIALTDAGGSRIRVDYQSEGKVGGQFPIEHLRPLLINIYSGIIDGAVEQCRAVAD